MTTSDPVPPVITIQPIPSEPARPMSHWLRLILAGNPFYILSAVLLLYSMRRLSLDTGIFHDETSQLIFNFSSFQVYELLLAGTAVFLARRRIWYDSGLLVGLETLFVFVPFILVSQALLIEGSIAFLLCLCGSVLALTRARALKKWIASLNAPPQLLAAGAFLLGLNLALPVLTRLLHKDVAMPQWDERGVMLNFLEWYVALPMAIGTAWIFPAATAGREENAGVYSRRWFPLFALLAWAGGTGAHLYCIGYVYGIRWNMTLLTPAIWAAAWMLWKRRLDFLPEQAGGLVEKAVLALPLAAGALPLVAGNQRLCVTFSMLNVLIYGILAFRRRDFFAFRLVLLSLALATTSFPWKTTEVASTADWLESLGVATFGFGLLTAIFSRNPKLGILGGVSLAMLMSGILKPFAAMDVNAAIQAGFVFLILHSLRWNDGKDERIARYLAICYWLAHAAAWIGDGSLAAKDVVFASGLSVFIIYCTARCVTGIWGPRAVAVAALAAMAMPPSLMAARVVARAPEGIAILLASFALFAVGTFTALAKSRESKLHTTL